MLACSFDISASNAIGLLCAFGSAVVFVSSNIFFKKIMPTPSAHGSQSTSSHKLDKLNLLFYSSSMAFILMVPIWAYYDLPILLTSVSGGPVSHPAHPGPAHVSIVAYLFANGTVHFLQNVLAFVLLARTSPVTYSIASLVKRVAVICAAILWFSQRVHPIQGVGIAMTFGGLYLYNKAVKKGDVDRGERKVRRIEKAWEGELPQTKDEIDSDVELIRASPVAPREHLHHAYTRPTANSHPPTRTPITLSYSEPHPRMHPNLHIQITPHATPVFATQASAGVKVEKDDRSVTPTGSYPSPPPSLDSPPASSALMHSPWPVKKRRGTVNGYVLHDHVQPAGFMGPPRTAALVDA